MVNVSLKTACLVLYRVEVLNMAISVTVEMSLRAVLNKFLRYVLVLLVRKVRHLFA